MQHRPGKPDSPARTSRSGLESILVNTGYLTATRITAGLSRGIYALMLAAYLGPELYGLFNYGNSWYLLLVPIATLGIDRYLVREIGRNTQNARCLINRTLGARIAAGAAIILLSFMLARLVEDVPANRAVLYAFSFALLGRSLFIWVTSVLNAYETTRFVFVIESLFRIGEVAIGIILLIAEASLLYIVLLHTISWLTQAIAGLLYVNRHMFRLSISLDLASLGNLLKRGAPFLLSALFLNWILQGPLVLFRHLAHDEQQLGQLALVMQAFFIIGTILSEAGNAALPVLSRSVRTENDHAQRFIDATLRLGILMGSLLVVCGLTIAEPLIAGILGDHYAVTANLLPYALALVAPYFWLFTLNSLMVAHGHFWRHAMIGLGGAIGFSLASPLLWYLQALGAILATATGLTLTLGLLLFILSKKHHIAFVRSIVQLAVTLGSGMVASLALQEAQPFLALFLAVIATLCAAVLSRVIRPAELSALRAQLRRMPADH